ncbi:MAG: leucine-rich repeat domain-containing protein, partial [Synergistaceae bacterium]|nr:leucine-rich repeat domain-containing protein [Synergistaceae bacterium]
GTAGLRRIGARAFENCTVLVGTAANMANVPAGQTGTGLRFNGLVSVGESAFAGCSGLERIAVPRQTAFETNAFSGASSLTSIYFMAVELPSSVSSFLIDVNSGGTGKDAFAGTRVGAVGGTLSVVTTTVPQIERKLSNIVLTTSVVADPSDSNDPQVRAVVLYLNNAGFSASEIQNLSGIPAATAQRVIDGGSTPPPPPVDVPVTDINWEPVSSVKEGSQVTLVGNTLPTTADVKTVSWRIVSGSEFATLSGNVLSGVKKGTVVVQAYAPNGLGGGKEFPGESRNINVEGSGGSSSGCNVGLGAFALAAAALALMKRK